MKFNSSIGLFFKGLNFFISFVLTRLALQEFGVDAFGQYNAILSLVQSFLIFDFGLNNGVRNICIRQTNDLDIHKNIVYGQVLLIIIWAILVGLFFLFKFLFNNSVYYSSVLNDSTLFSFFLSLFSLQFILNGLRLININHITHGRTAIVDFIDFSLILAVLCLNYFFFYIEFFSIYLFAFIQLLVPIIYFVYINLRSVFVNAYKFLFFELVVAKNIIKSSFGFFLLSLNQILNVSLIAFLINYFSEPMYVTQYVLANKVFGLLSFGFISFLTPYWNAFGRAQEKKKKIWIILTVKKLEKYWIYLFLLGFVIVTVFPYTVKILFGSKAIELNFIIYFLVFLYIMATCRYSIYAHVLNGMGEKRLQILILVSVGVFNLSLSLVFGNLFGVIGVLSINVLALFLISLLYQFFTTRIIKRII